MLHQNACTHNEEKVFDAILRALRQSELRETAAILRRKRHRCLYSVRGLAFAEDLRVAKENLPIFLTALGQVLQEKEVLQNDTVLSAKILPQTIDDLYFCILELTGCSTK